MHVAYLISSPYCDAPFFARGDEIDVVWVVAPVPATAGGTAPVPHAAASRLELARHNTIATPFITLPRLCRRRRTSLAFLVSDRSFSVVRFTAQPARLCLHAPQRLRRRHPRCSERRP